MDRELCRIAAEVLQVNIITGTSPAVSVDLELGFAKRRSIVHGVTLISQYISRMYEWYIWLSRRNSGSWLYLDLEIPFTIHIWDMRAWK